VFTFDITTRRVYIEPSYTELCYIELSVIVSPLYGGYMRVIVKTFMLYIFLYNNAYIELG